MAIEWKDRTGKPCAFEDERGPFHADVGGLRVWLQLMTTGWVVTCDGLKVHGRTLETMDKVLARENAMVVISTVASQFVSKFAAVRDAAEAELKNHVAKLD